MIYQINIVYWIIQFDEILYILLLERLAPAWGVVKLIWGWGQ